MEINSVSQSTVSQLLGSIKSSSTNGAENTETNGSNDYLGASFNTVSISAFGQQINELYAQTNNIADANTRQLAREGLTAVMEQFAQSPDSVTTASFINSMQDIAETDSGLFQDFLTTAAAVKTEGFDLQQWTETFTRIGDRDSQHAFVRETNSIMESGESDALIQATFTEFINTTNQILDADLESEATSNQLRDYFTAVSDSESLSAKRDAIANYGDSSY